MIPSKPRAGERQPRHTAVFFRQTRKQIRKKSKIETVDQWAAPITYV